MQVLTLKNSKVAVSFCKKTGSVAQIERIASGKRFLSEPAGARLFRMMIPLEEWPNHYADSHMNNKPVLQLKGDSVEIVFEDLKDIRKEPTGLKVKVTARLPEDSSEVFFSMEVENSGKHVVEQVRFPWVGGLTSIDGEDADRVAVASKFFNLHKMFPRDYSARFCRVRYKMVFEYPIPLFLPYLDISGKDQGLGYICYLDKARIGNLGFEQLDPYGKNPSMSFAWAAHPFLKPGGSWSSPDIGISTHKGDWHRTADRFRDWVYTWWKDPNPPERLKKSIGVGNISFRDFDGRMLNEFSDMPELAEECKKSEIKDICVWHRAGGTYMVCGSTKEVFDEPAPVLKELEEALGKVKKAGFNMNVILNLRLVKTIFEPYKEVGESEAMRSKDGSPASRETFAASTYHLDNFYVTYNLGDSVTLCQRPDSLYAERADRIIDKMLNLGFTSIFVDQPVNERCCFAPHHKHASTDIAPSECVEWVAGVGRKVKNRSEGGYIIGELPELFQTENIDLWWHWAWSQLSPEIYRYSHPRPLHLWVIDDELDQMNKAFTLGFLLTFTPAGMEKTMKSRPEAAKHCKTLAKLKNKVADYIVDTRFADREGLKMRKRQDIEAAVYVGRDRAAVIIAETEGKTTDITVGFKPGEHGLCLKTSEIYRTAGRKERVPVSGKEACSVKLSLDPYEVAVWTMKAGS